MKQLLCLPIVFLFCISITLFAQQPEWKNYTNGDYITALEFEGDLVWIGTWGGVVQINRTTGDTFYYDKLNSGLPHNHISCIAIDASGNKWIGTGDILVKFDGTDWTVYNTFNLGSINCITIDNSGNKWIGTWGGGLAKFDDTNWTVYNESNSGLPEDRIYCITIDSDGKKWIGTINGLAKTDGTDWTVYKSALPSNRVECISIDNSGNKWIGTEEGLAKFDDANWTIYNDSNSALPSNHVECISIDNSGNKWIATAETWNSVEQYSIEKALVKFDGTNWTVYSKNNLGSQGNNTSVLMTDEEGIIWIGNYSRKQFGNVSGYGLYTFDGTTWTNINTSSSGLTDNSVDCITIDY